MRTRARRTEQDVAALRADVSDLRNLATARLRVIDDLSERVVELEAVVYSLNTELARHIEFHPSPVAAVVDLAPVSDDVELGPPYDAGQPEPAAEEPDPEPAAEPQLTDEQAVRDTEARVRHHYALSGRALREVGDAVRNSTLTDAQKVGVIAGVLANGPLDDAPGGPCEGAVFAARREAFREAVEALIPDEVHVLVQSAIDPNAHVTTQAVEVLRTLRGMLTARFLSPDNPEGNA